VVTACSTGWRATGYPACRARSRRLGDLCEVSGAASQDNTVGGEETLRAQEVTAAEGLTRLQPRGGPLSQAGKPSTAAPPRDALPIPRPAHPTPFLLPRTQPSGPGQKPRDPPPRSRAVLHPGPWASTFPPSLREPSGSSLPLKSDAGWQDVPTRPALPERAEEQNQGPALAPGLSPARWNQGGCSSCSLGGDAFGSRVFPWQSATSLCSKHWGLSRPSGKEGCGFLGSGSGGRVSES
jgi:hypothetical protein